MYKRQVVDRFDNLLSFAHGGVTVHAAASSGTIEFTAVRAVLDSSIQHLIDDGGGNLKAIPEIFVLTAQKLPQLFICLLYTSRCV